MPNQIILQKHTYTTKKKVGTQRPQFSSVNELTNKKLKNNTPIGNNDYNHQKIKQF